jgi:hypothetical protein
VQASGEFLGYNYGKLTCHNLRKLGYGARLKPW